MANERKEIFRPLSRPGDEIREGGREQYENISRLWGVKLARADYDVIFFR